MDDPEYSPFFYMMLLVGIIGQVGFFARAACFLQAVDCRTRNRRLKPGG